MVGIIKGIIKKAKMSNTNVNKALLAYRSSPLSNSSRSPAELLSRRKIASGLPVKIESTPDALDYYSQMVEAKEKNKSQYDSRAKPEMCQSGLLPGMKVLVQDGKSWFPATVKDKTDEPRSYKLVTPNGYEIRRNRKFLRELSENASRKFQFTAHQMPDDHTPLVPEVHNTPTKSVSFEGDENISHVIPETPAQPTRPRLLPASPSKRPTRNIQKPIRYRVDIDSAK